MRPKINFLHFSYRFYTFTEKWISILNRGIPLKNSHAMIYHTEFYEMYTHIRGCWVLGLYFFLVKSIVLSDVRWTWRPELWMFYCFQLFFENWPSWNYSMNWNCGSKSKVSHYLQNVYLLIWRWLKCKLLPLIIEKFSILIFKVLTDPKKI